MESPIKKLIHNQIYENLQTDLNRVRFLYNLQAQKKKRLCVFDSKSILMKKLNLNTNPIKKQQIMNIHRTIEEKKHQIQAEKHQTYQQQKKQKHISNVRIRRQKSQQTLEKRYKVVRTRHRPTRTSEKEKKLEKICESCPGQKKMQKSQQFLNNVEKDVIMKQILRRMLEKKVL